MLKERDKSVLKRIISHCERVEDKIKGAGFAYFLDNADLREIVCFNLFQIGELAKHLSEEFLLEFSGLPWKEIKGMQDVIGHGYGTVEWDIVFQTACGDIPEVKRYCLSILGR